jgi:hypothetical protein
MAHAYPERKTDFLIVHPKFGVYLGSAQGRGYWSKVDSVGQPAAVTFPSQQEAIAYMASWAVSPPAGVQLLPVVSDGPGYATIAACVRAGAPAWLDPLTPTANGRAQAM